MEASYEKLAGELKALVGYDMLYSDAGGIKITADAKRVAQVAKELNEGAVGFYDTGAREIVMPAPKEWISYEEGQYSFMLYDEMYDVVLAHEIGHAMGLGHDGSPLMGPMSEACDGRAAKCLLESLHIRY